MVTVCKYFLTNSCRYGDRCRYSHVLPTESYRSNPYVYDARHTNKTEGVSIMQRLASPNINKSPPHHQVDDLEGSMPEYLKKIIDDVNQIELHQMWPLTCYAVVKNQGNFPGWNDISMEEVRWEAYQAQANGTTHIYLAKMQELLAHAKELRLMLLRPSAETESKMRDYFRGINTTPANTSENVPFTFNQSSKALSNFSFASAFENKPSVFNQTSNTSSSGFFNQAIQPNNTFNQIPSSQESFFGAKSSFDAQPSNIFGSNPFQETSSSTMDINSIFSSGNQNHSFGSALNSSQGRSRSFKNDSTGCESIYSKVEDLSKEDYEAFKANTFTLENLPLEPPPKELCL